MRFSDIDDCSLCLMMKRGYCKGGVTMGDYGEPVYPPCAYSNAIVHAFQEGVKNLVSSESKSFG